MKIQSFQELRKLLALCREQGVNIIKVDGMELVLEGKPLVKAKPIRREAPLAPGGITEETQIALPQDLIDTPDALTPEQLLNWSVGSDQ